MRNNESTLLSPEMSDETLCRLAQQSNGSAAEDLVKRYTRLVKTCARPFFLAGADAEDVIQEGMLGLMKAIREFDSTKGVPFNVFARLCIQRKIYSATRSASALKHRPLNQSMSLDRPLFEDLSEMQAENVSLTTKKMNSMDMTEVEQHAVDDLGMVKMDNSQIEYVELTRPDVVTVAHSEHSLENVVSGLTEWFSSIVEYIR